MAEKLKLGIVGDAGVPTGFATVTHNLAGYLQDTGDYDIQIIGINFDGAPNQWSKKFNIWPARLGGDYLGIGLVPRFVEETKPDAFMLFQDFWNIPQYIGGCKPGQPGLLAYYPVDAPNIKGGYMMPLGAVMAAVCYTDFGANESVRAVNEGWDHIKHQAKEGNVNVLDNLIVNLGPTFDPATHMQGPARQVKVSARKIQSLRHKDGFEVIPHGVDTKAFFPVSKKGARKALGLPVDGFYIGNVNRNQSRKRIDLTIRAFAKFSKEHPDARLVLHCVASDMQGWDLEQLSVYYGVRDKVIFSHSMFPNLAATTEQLNLLYNSFNVQINTGGGEGWGLCLGPDSLIQTKNGPRFIPDVVVGDEVLTETGEYEKVLGTTNRKVDRYLEVEIEDHWRLHVTEEHPFLTLRETKAIGRRKATTEPVWVPILELREGDYVAVGRIARANLDFKQTLYEEVINLVSTPNAQLTDKGTLVLKDVDPFYLMTLQLKLRSVGVEATLKELTTVGMFSLRITKKALERLGKSWIGYAPEGLVNVNGYLFAKIKGISHVLNESRVYDLLVENTHSFVANNVIVHNTSFEGAAAGIPQIVPDWSATKEIWEGSGKLIKVASVRHEPATINTMQSVIDTDHLCELLNEFHASQDLQQSVGEACFAVTQRPEYRWENVGKKFDEVFKKIAGKTPAMGPVAITTKGQIELQKKGLL